MSWDFLLLIVRLWRGRWRVGVGDSGIIAVTTCPTTAVTPVSVTGVPVACGGTPLRIRPPWGASGIRLAHHHSDNSDPDSSENKNLTREKCSETHGSQFTRTWHLAGVCRHGCVRLSVQILPRSHICFCAYSLCHAHVHKMMNTRGLLAFLTRWWHGNSSWLWSVKAYTPGNTKYLYNICTLLVQRRRRWAGVVQMLYKCLALKPTGTCCPMLAHLYTSVADVDPQLGQHRITVLCLLRGGR